LGAWLGLWQTLLLFIYMALSGLLLIVFVLWHRGLLLGQIRQIPAYLLNLILLRPYGRGSRSAETEFSQPFKSEKIPYGVALAMGMAMVCWRGFLL
jgi:hypothetical protein